MALGATTYKTPNIINQIGQNLTSFEGCGVYLDGANTITIAELATDIPYGIIVTGTDSLTPGTYPSSIGDASLELVDQLGCVVQVLISSEDDVTAGQFLSIDEAVQDGTFTHFSPTTPGQWVWGIALTNAGPGEQCLMRFQPYVIQYIAP